MSTSGFSGSDISDDVFSVDLDPDDMDSAEKLATMISLRDEIVWEYEEDRQQFLRDIFPLIRNWESQLPDPREIFTVQQIELLLADSINCSYTVRNAREREIESKFVGFIARSGYKDEAAPASETGGEPPARRRTLVHHAADKGKLYHVRELFEIYDACDVNYQDEQSGLTHLHLACMAGCYGIVQRFLDLGQDPNCLDGDANTPLHSALENLEEDVGKLLLRRGADPNAANSHGMTPLHVICRQEFRADLAQTFFEICDEMRLSVDIDAKDTLGRTPLQWAVASIGLDLIDLLVDRGADLAGFVFPAADHIVWEGLACRYDDASSLLPASGLMACVERLEKRGYEMDLEAAVNLMQVFAACNMFYSKPSHLADDWWDDEEFVAEAKRIKIRPRSGEEWKYENAPIAEQPGDKRKEDEAATSWLTLHELVRLPRREASKLVAYADYLNLARNHWERLGSYETICAGYLCERMSRDFFLDWALDSFWLLLRLRLPLHVCDAIIGSLTNEDLYRVCLASLL